MKKKDYTKLLELYDELRELQELRKALEKSDDEQWTGDIKDKKTLHLNLKR